MPTINSTGKEDADGSPIAEAVRLSLSQLTITTSPVLIVGVNRKCQIGNFESVDIYAGLALPVEGLSIDDQEMLSNKMTEVATLGFSIVSKETGDRYNQIHELQEGRI